LIWFHLGCHLGLHLGLNLGFRLEGFIWGKEAYQQERIKQKKQKNKETVKKESCEAEFVLSLAHFSLFLLIPIMSFDPNANLFLILMIFF